MAASPGLFQPSYGVNSPGTADFSFSFLTAGDSVAPSESSIRGTKVASITAPATGKYEVTLDAPYYQVLTAVASLNDSSTGDGGQASVYIADEAASPLVVTVFTTNAAGTKTAFTGRRVNVNLRFKLSVGA